MVQYHSWTQGRGRSQSWAATTRTKAGKAGTASDRRTDGNAELVTDTQTLQRKATSCVSQGQRRYVCWQPRAKRLTPLLWHDHQKLRSRCVLAGRYLRQDVLSARHTLSLGVPPAEPETLCGSGYPIRPWVRQAVALWADEDWPQPESNVDVARRRACRAYVSGAVQSRTDPLPPRLRRQDRPLRARSLHMREIPGP